MAVEFREILPREIERVSEITVDAFSLYYPRYSQTARRREISTLSNEIHQLTERKVSKYYVLLQDNSIIGSVALTLYRGHCYLNSMVIDPSLQRQGYGKILLENVVQIVRERKFGNIYLYANHAGTRLYEKGGFLPSFRVNPIKLSHINAPKGKYEVAEFNFELPKWIQKIEQERFGKQRIHLYDYLFSLDADLLTIGENAYCTLRDQTIGNLYASSPEYALALLHEAWNLGGEYFNSIDNSEFMSISNRLSYTVNDELSCTRMFLGEETGNFKNFYGVLSFGFG